MKNKHILLISPQKWSAMFVSKHHYAIALAKNGNKVFFLNPIQPGFSSPKIEQSEYKNIYIVSISISNAARLRYRIPKLFRYLLSRKIKKVLEITDKTIDAVWDFDCHNILANYDLFEKAIKIFHPVDQVGNIPKNKIPDIIFSVSDNILNNYQNINVPKYFINHGIGDDFIQLAKSNLEKLDKQKFIDTIEAAYVGNLMIHALNHQLLLDLVKGNQTVKFHFFGPYATEYDKKYSRESVEFVRELQQQQNVSLHGLCSSKELVKAFGTIDIFLLNYTRSQFYNADNSHKLLEYLCTGQIVLSSTLSVYTDSDLFVQADGEADFLRKFKFIIENLPRYNDRASRKKRLEYVLQNSYQNQLAKIEEKLIEHRLI